VALNRGGHPLGTPAGRWDATADVLVVGFGAAGAAAAIHAADLGASVIVVEKQEHNLHVPSSRTSSGQVLIADHVARALGYFDRCAAGLIPSAVSHAWLERSTRLIAWLESAVGLAMVRVGGAEHTGFDGADAVSSWGPEAAYARSGRLTTHGGETLLSALHAAVRRRPGIDVRYAVAAHRLVRDESGRVIGVVGGGDSGERRLGARKAVVLACGGFDHDEEMKRQYVLPDPTYFYGSPANEGDGIRMAQAVGADLWHMNCVVGRAVAHVRPAGAPHTYPVAMTPGGYVLTDKYGERFADESLQAAFRHDFYHELIYYDPARAERPRIPCYWFFDQRRMAEPIVIAEAFAIDAAHRYAWSYQAADELAKGWLYAADDVETLAAQAGLSDPRGAATTIEAYNSACRTGTDAFGRPAESLVPLSEPPFYCMPLWPGGPSTSGGPRRNEHAQILDVHGAPIPGLYAAGLLGWAIGPLLPAPGANNGDALCFGQMAVDHALGTDRR
jgi:succinate dehydrogenase/fumarate reductase flavoprotein subunit